MSYFIVDKNGAGADFATCRGLSDLRDLGLNGLTEFLDNGQADDSLKDRVIEECINHPDTDYISDLFAGMDAPIILTDGTGGDEEEIEASEPKINAEEARDEHGRWARSILSGDERASKLAEFKALKEKASAVYERGKHETDSTGLTGLTRKDADEFADLNRKMNAVHYDLARPLKSEKIPSEQERKSTLPVDTVQIAHSDLFKNKHVWSAISDSATGTYYNRNTPVDDIMDGKNKDVTAKEFYDTFQPTRDSLKEKFGNEIELHRAVGKQMNKPTQNWATTREFAKQFGGNVLSKKIPISNIIAVNVGPFGKYHELIVGNPPEEKLTAAAPFGNRNASKDYKTQFLKNINETSRTAKSGKIDTSTAPEKTGSNLPADQLRKQTEQNAENLFKHAADHKDDDFSTPRKVADFVTQANKLANQGVSEHAYRSWDGPKGNGWTPAKDVPAMTSAYYQELSDRLTRGDDPVKTAAWHEQTFDHIVHPFADGVGRTSKAVSAMILMRGNHDLPTYPDRKEYYGHAHDNEADFEKFYRGMYGDGSVKAGAPKGNKNAEKDDSLRTKRIGKVNDGVVESYQEPSVGVTEHHEKSWGNGLGAQANRWRYRPSNLNVNGKNEVSWTDKPSKSDMDAVEEHMLKHGEKIDLHKDITYKKTYRITAGAPKGNRNAEKGYHKASEMWRIGKVDDEDVQSMPHEPNTFACHQDFNWDVGYQATPFRYRPRTNDDKEAKVLWDVQPTDKEMDAVEYHLEKKGVGVDIHKPWYDMSEGKSTVYRNNKYKVNAGAPKGNRNAAKDYVKPEINPADAERLKKFAEVPIENHLKSMMDGMRNDAPDGQIVTHSDRDPRLIMIAAAGGQQIRNVSQFLGGKYDVKEVPAPEFCKDFVEGGTFPGQCYDKAGQFIAGCRYDAPEKCTLVHGFIGNKETTAGFGHGWVEIGDHTVFDGVRQKFYDKEDYFRKLGAISEQRYTPDESVKMMLQKKFYGPWGPTLGVTGGPNGGRK